MAEFQSKFTGQEIENTIDKLRNWLAAGIDGTYPTVTISSVTYDVIWKVIPMPGAKCYGIGLDRTTGRPYEIYYDGSSYKATALDANTDTKNTAGSTNSTSKLYLVGANTLAENPQTFANNQVYMADGTLYLTKTKDLSGVADNKPALIVGGTNTTAHIEIDADEIHAKASGTTVAPLYLNHDGGNTYLSGKKTYSDGNYLYSDNKKVSAEGHTHSFDAITNRGEAFLSWGGKNFSGSYGPIDAAMVPELGANRLAFMPANAVTIEYSRDGGSTWTDYGPTDSQKADLFNGRGASFTIGKATSGEGNIATNKYQLRVNIYTSAGRVYTVLNKFVIYLSTSGTNNNWCTIRARKQSDYTANKDTWTTFADKISVSGWSGYNVINTSGITTYGNTASTQYGHIQFIFGCDTGSTNNSYAGLNINKIFGFGGVGWTTPSTMAKTGHMYTYDSSQNVIFPAGVSATSFTEGGKSLASKYAAKSHTHNYAGSSSAGGIANSAKELGTLFYKASEAAGAEGYYKIATITHKTWSYCSFTMFTTNSYSGAKFNTLFDVRCSDNADSLNGFAFNIIGGTDISNKLKYLETKSGNNTTKIEIFMQCSRYEHPKFYLVTSSTSNGLAINTTDWGDTPDKASSTAMTGSAANTIKAAALTASAGSAIKPIYFNNGIPTECNYALEKAVPSDAIFTDTKNTAGSIDDAGKLYLVGTKNQSESEQTYSNGNVYMSSGTLTASRLKTSTIGTNSETLSIIDSSGASNFIARFDSSGSTDVGTHETLQGHLVVWGQDDSSNTRKPADKTGFDDLDTYYFNTGIALYDDGIGTTHKLSFPGKSGTFLLDSDLVELTLTDNGNKRYLIGSGSAGTWSDIGTNSKVYTQSGSLYATYFYGTSDRRLKENIKDLDLNCLDLVNNINLREFSWKADKEHKPTIGAVAQELRQVLPEKYVHEFIGGQETDDEYLSINDSKLVYLLIGAIQEQQKEIENLKAKIDGKIV